MPLIPWPQFVAWFAEHQNLLGWLAGLSLVTFVGSLVLVPMVILYLPKDFMSYNHRVVRSWPVLLYVPMLVAKNTVGVLFFLAGLAMLVLPGQGLLTMVIGLLLLDLPGKRRLIRRLIGRPRIFRMINQLRLRFGKPPLELPD